MKTDQKIIEEFLNKGTEEGLGDLSLMVPTLKQALLTAEKRVLLKLKQYTEYQCEHNVDDPVEVEIQRIQNIGFEEAHNLRDCGHSVGDYRDINYGTDKYDGDEKCVGCEKESNIKQLVRETCLSEQKIAVAEGKQQERERMKEIVEHLLGQCGVNTPTMQSLVLNRAEFMHFIDAELEQEATTNITKE